MTDSPVPGPDTSREARPPARKIVRAGLRAAGSTAALVTLQVRSVVTSPFPGLWAVEALATSLPLFLLLFASTYLVTATEAAGSFSQPLTHTDALYFTVTVFATVGFGDITAKTEAARLVVTGQMILDLIIIGIGARIILGAVRQSRQRRPEHTNTPRPSE